MRELYYLTISTHLCVFYSTYLVHVYHITDVYTFKHTKCEKEHWGRLNKKDGLTRYGDSHVKDKTS